ncbi:MAG: DUF3971 domain-containing protein, partial [Gammaproteobacteria bacterium]
MLKSAFHALWTLLLVLLVLISALVAAARLWIPEVGAYRMEIEQAAGQALNKQVTIGRLQAGWRGLNPVIKLKNVELSDPAGTHEMMAVREIWLTVDAEQSLAHQQIKLAGIDVVGAEFTLVHASDGTFYLEGFRTDNDDSDMLADLLQMALSVHDVNITYIDEASGEPPRRFSAISLSLRNHGATHTVTGHALLPADMGYRADVEAVLYGYSSRPQDWQGQVYIKGHAVALTGVLGPVLTDDQLVEGVADLRLWLDLGEAGIESASGEIDTAGLKIIQHNETQAYIFAADSLRGQFGWRQSDKGWQFAVQKLVVNQQQRRWETDNLSLAGRQQQDSLSIKGLTSLVVLDGVGALLPIIPGLTVEQRQLLGDLQPRGTVRDLVFNITSRDKVTRVNDFSAHFSGLSIEQSGILPKLSGLDGTLRGDMEAGILSLSSQNTVLHDDRLFREPLPIDELQGDIYWQLRDGTMEVATDALTIRNDDLSLLARTGLYLPVDGSAASINLMIDVATARLDRLHAYLPAKIMSPLGVAWLDSSLNSGLITDGRVVVNGRLDQLPFDKGEGVLEVRLPVTDAVLDFNEDWSPLTGLDAQVDFTGRVMDIVSSRGAMRSASLESVHAQIKDLASPVLTLKGVVHGDLPVMLAELGSSPLGMTYGGFVDRVSTTGKTTLGLDIVVPLDDSPAPIEVAGDITLRGNSLRVNDSDIELKDIKGHLVFDPEGIQGDKLQLRLFDHPASARVWTETGNHQTNIHLQGPLQLFDRFIEKDSFLGAAASGSSDWQVRVALRGIPERGKNADIGVTVTSDLVGTAIDLPAPFGKGPESVRQLTIVEDRVGVEESTVRLNYSDFVEGLLQIIPGEDGFKLQKGAITVAGKKPVLPDSKQLLFSGHLDRFRLTDWQPYLGGSGSASDAGGGDADLPLAFDVAIDELEVLGHELGEVSLTLKSSGSRREIRVDGPAVAGDIELTSTAAGLDSVTMTLERLALESGSGEQQQAGSA